MHNVLEKRLETVDRRRLLLEPARETTTDPRSSAADYRRSIQLGEDEDNPVLLLRILSEGQLDFWVYFWSDEFRGIEIQTVIDLLSNHWIFWEKREENLKICASKEIGMSMPCIECRPYYGNRRCKTNSIYEEWEQFGMGVNQSHLYHTAEPWNYDDGTNRAIYARWRAGLYF